MTELQEFQIGTIQYLWIFRECAPLKNDVEYMFTYEFLLIQRFVFENEIGTIQYYHSRRLWTDKFLEQIFFGPIRSKQ